MPHRLIRILSVLLLSVGLLYLVWNLYFAGEAGFAAMILAIAVGVLVLYGTDRFYNSRFIYPAIIAVLVFIALPVAYTSYLGFTNFGGRNLLDFDSATRYHLNLKEIDPSSERPYALVKEGESYRIWLPEGEGGLLSEPFQAGETAQSVTAHLQIEIPTTLPLKEVLPLRTALSKVTVVLDDGTELNASGLRSFAKVRPLYVQEGVDTLRNTADQSLLIADHDSGFYRDAAGQPISPGWRVGVGLSNFERILTSDSIRAPMLRIFVWTITFAFLSMIFTFMVGLLLASLLQWEPLAFKSVYRVLLILPYAVPAFISILIFRGLFNQNFGEINLILHSLFGIRPEWFTDPYLARTMLVLVNTWLGYPYMMLLAMGYLQAVPRDQYEAAAIEGSTPLHNFWRITLPQILPPFIPMLIANFAFNFNNIVLILLLTRGLPDIPGTQIPAGYTDLLASFTFRVSFLDSGQNFGIAGAITTLIFLIVAVLAYANLLAVRRMMRKGDRV